MSQSKRMNDNPELYNKTNNVTRKDAITSLNEFVPKFRWNNNPRVMDIGSADGSVTTILSHYLPQKYEVLIGCDVNKKSVEFANKCYSNDRIHFIHLDIEAELPDHLLEDFDHVFSFYTLHWLSDPAKGYRNVYNLLKPGGECFITVSAKTPFFDVFRAMSRTKKWAYWTKDIEKMVSPYQDCEDPDNLIHDVLKKIGFYHVETKCKQKVHVYENVQVFKDNIASVNPFKIPSDLQEEFMEDYADVARVMGHVGEDNSVTFMYNIVQIHCIK